MSFNVLVVKRNRCILRTKIYVKRQWRRSGLYFPKKYKSEIYKIVIFVPGRWRVTMFAPQELPNNTLPVLFRLMSDQYFFNFSAFIDKGLLSFCYNTQAINITSYTSESTSLTLWQSTLNNLLFLFSSFFFHKIKFKGKGYYIYKNWRNTIAPQFGYYHRIYIYSFFAKVKFLSKTKVLLFGLTKTDILRVAYDLKSKRPINIFTGRGVRFAKEVIYKKTGKVSSYR